MLLKICLNVVLCKYAPSAYDPNVNGAEKEELMQQSGFIENHFADIRYKKPFGDFSVMTLNAHTHNDLLENAEETDVIHLLNSHHVSIFGLQGVSKTFMEKIDLQLGNGHYKMFKPDKGNVDYYNDKTEFSPVIYDSKLFTLLEGHIFEPINSRQKAYATWTVFASTTNREILFNLINADLFSDDSNATDKQMLTILEHIKSGKFRGYPLLLIGTVNKVSESLKDIFDKYLNDASLDKDKNNRTLSKNTFHGRLGVNDNVLNSFTESQYTGSGIKARYESTLGKVRKV